MNGRDVVRRMLEEREARRRLDQLVAAGEVAASRAEERETVQAARRLVANFEALKAEVRAREVASASTLDEAMLIRRAQK